MKLHKVFNNRVTGIVLSVFSLLLLFFINHHTVNERMLNEGAKEMIGMINKESFFYLWPERIFMFVTQLIPLMALKLGASLQFITYLYAMNLFICTVLVYLYAVRRKEYYAGVYLAGLQIIGFTFCFYLYPFLEHYYALLFCYLLHHLIDRYQPGDHWRLVVGFALIAMIVTAYPVCLIFLGIVLFQSKLKPQLQWSIMVLGGVLLVLSMAVTDVHASSKIHNFRLGIIPEYFKYFTIIYPDLILLYLATLLAAWKLKNRWIMILLIIPTLAPYLLHFQVLPYHYALPVGASLLMLAISDRWKANKFIAVLVLALFIFNLQRIDRFHAVYENIRYDVDQIVAQARAQGDKKVILVRNADTEHFFQTGQDYPFEEAIMHSSILRSSLEGNQQSVIVQSIDFNYMSFAESPDTNHVWQSESEMIEFINSIYNDAEAKTLVGEYLKQYEYSKYFFTSRMINQRYFGIPVDESYSILRFQPQ